jgi:hypothetical protein
MEAVLDLYEKEYDPYHPVICLDEKLKQLLAEVRKGQPVQPGQAERIDYEYERRGTANLFIIFEPLAGFRHLIVTERRTALDYAMVLKWLVDEGYPEAEWIELVEDNLNTHSAASLYETFPPEEARRLARKLRFTYTPKHASWLNMAEIELSVFERNCLGRRIGDIETLKQQVAALEAERNAKGAKVNWQFTNIKARQKLGHLYPSYQSNLD